MSSLHSVVTVVFVFVVRDFAGFKKQTTKIIANDSEVLMAA